MKILNLYAGLGGNRRSWSSDHKVTAVEINPEIAEVYSRHFPEDTLVIGDAHSYLTGYAHLYDFVWSSPPCQSHSFMVKATRHNVKRYPELDLYQEIIYLQHFFKGLWCVENVKPYYTPLIAPSSEIGRHIFWSNFRITKFEVENYPKFTYNDNKKHVQRLKDWLGIQYPGNIYYGTNNAPGQVLRNCVPPALGLHVLNCSLGKYEYNKNVKQLTIETL